jgi:hypothetical protein
MGLDAADAMSCRALRWFPRQIGSTHIWSLRSLPQLALLGGAGVAGIIGGRSLSSVMATAIDPGPTVMGMVRGIKRVGRYHWSMGGPLVVPLISPPGEGSSRLQSRRVHRRHPLRARYTEELKHIRARRAASRGAGRSCCGSQAGRCPADHSPWPLRPYSRSPHSGKPRLLRYCDGAEWLSPQYAEETLRVLGHRLACPIWSPM